MHLSKFCPTYPMDGRGEIWLCNFPWNCRCNSLFLTIGVCLQPAKHWLWVCDWFSEICFMKSVHTYVCIYLPISVCLYAPMWVKFYMVKCKKCNLNELHIKRSYSWTFFWGTYVVSFWYVVWNTNVANFYKLSKLPSLHSYPLNPHRLIYRPLHILVM